ncbi:MAG: hypothetical protein ACREDK_03265 [Thermoplasmata archaeon]
MEGSEGGALTSIVALRACPSSVPTIRPPIGMAIDPPTTRVSP